MKKLSLLVVLVLFVCVGVVQAKGEMPPDHPLFPVPSGRVVRPLNVRVEVERELQPNTAGCGVAGEFSLNDEPCEWNQWEDDLTDWFVPELEFSWQLGR